MKSEFKKIAIICASERELAPFLPLIENPTISERAMLRIHEGRLNGFEVAAVYCGVCKVNAAAAAQIMIDCYGADTVISAEPPAEWRKTFSCSTPLLQPKPAIMMFTNAF